MKIGLLGYGKMGKTIDHIAKDEFNIAAIIQKNELHKINKNEIDVIIEFTTPETAVDNIMLCINAGIPVICGTTGWLLEIDKIEAEIISKKGIVIYASNFSIGVNIFFKLNTHLAKLMNEWEDYKASITEIHHTEKKDKPSGTAISIANQIIESNNSYSNYSLQNGVNDFGTLHIDSIRTPDVPGTHLVKYANEIDSIEIKHIANNREGFAKGALFATSFIPTLKPGIYNFSDLL